MLGKNLRELVRSHGLRPGEYADAAGLDRSYLSSLLNGTARSYPKAETLAKLARPFRGKVQPSQITGDGVVPTEVTPYDARPEYRSHHRHPRSAGA